MARNLYTGFFIISLHFGLILYLGHILYAEARGYIELGAQFCVASQPIFVVAFKIVYFSVFEREKRNGAEHFVIVFKAVHPVIFVQRIFKFYAKIVVRTVADTQNVETVVGQFTTELPIIRREIG